MRFTEARFFSWSLLSLSLIVLAPLACVAGTTESDGVTIKRNADGTVDVYDSTDSAPTPASTRQPARRSSGGSKYRPGTSNIGGVTVKRNADGTIETYDSGDSYVSSGGGGSKYRPGTSNIGGVTVKRNPDGTIETYEAETPVHRSVRSSTKSRSNRRAATGKTATRARKGSTNLGGVYVKRNPDGTIETFDAN